MEVILKDDVLHLGNRGDLVKVADGYARNFLLPRKLALQATSANKAVVEQMKNAAARRSATEKAQAEALALKLEPVVLDFTRKSGEAGHLFGSVTSADIAAALDAKGFEVDRRKIQLDEPLKSLGEFTVGIKLYREVVAHVKVNVLAEATEEAASEAKDAEPVADATVAE
jgi:large subunit ribosomal protein L9